MPKPRGAQRRTTATSAFGVSKRESHDATDFYARFATPQFSTDDTVNPCPVANEIFVGDARTMTQIPDNSVALVVTSPPYFAGKAYEEELGKGHIPATYVDYLEMLEAVFAECVRVLEPGGRIAVNVANLGRKPYRSLSADVIDILQNRLRLLLRGEVVWQKARGAAGNCAWGSFQRPANPVLRDLTERVIIASKGRLDRALTPKQRDELNLPSRVTISRDEFMEATVDVWDLPSESATRVGHPAPFPVELPERLIQLHTYVGDVILDPFMGSGSTAIAADRTGRRYLGYDTDATYVAAAKERIAEAQSDRVARDVPTLIEPGDPARPPIDSPETAFRTGAGLKDFARAVIDKAGATVVDRDVKIGAGVVVAFVAKTDSGEVLIDVVGGDAVSRPGLRRTEALWRTLGRASVASSLDDRPLIVLATDLPAANSAPGKAIAASVGPDKPIAAVIDVHGDEAAKHLADAFATMGAWRSTT